MLGHFPKSTRKHTLVQNPKEQQVWITQVISIIQTNSCEPSWMCFTRGYPSEVSRMMIFRERAHLQETKLFAIFTVSLMETVTVLHSSRVPWNIWMAPEMVAMWVLYTDHPKYIKLCPKTGKIGLSLLIQQETNWWSICDTTILTNLPPVWMYTSSDYYVAFHSQVKTAIQYWVDSAQQRHNQT